MLPAEASPSARLISRSRPSRLLDLLSKHSQHPPTPPRQISPRSRTSSTRTSRWKLVFAPSPTRRLSWRVSRAPNSSCNSRLRASRPHKVSRLASPTRSSTSWARSPRMPLAHPQRRLPR